MLFDDRLATVLRHRASGDLAARTQYRQLLDLLGQTESGADDRLVAAAFLRLHALGKAIPGRERARIVSDAASRIRMPDLVAQLAEEEPDVAASALAGARLSDDEWKQLIPELPVRARGFLRFRRDLPHGAVDLLDRLGVSDRGLPQPERCEPVETPAPRPQAKIEKEIPPARPATRSHEGTSIGALVERIEAYTKAREGAQSVGNAQSGSLAEKKAAPNRRAIASFCAGLDSRGRLEIADAGVAPMVVGLDLIAANDGITPRDAFATAFHNRQPVRGAQIDLPGATAVAGSWLIDAIPRFDHGDGRFLGYAARLRRPSAESAADRAESAADRIRQLLHELRTPVNAIQGFAEVIQQQLFGATPHEYRALAATIAGDAARMLAGFDELDRLAKLESAAQDVERGESDFTSIVRQQVSQLQNVLSARVAQFAAELPGEPTLLPVSESEAQMLAWRMLATLASATGAGETLALQLESNGDVLEMRCDLPGTLAASKNIFSTETRPASGAVSAGIFGAGFALRLARAEARAAGGELIREADRLLLTLPLSTTMRGDPSRLREPDRANG